MPRSARLVIPGAAHHVTQRGNSGQPVFHQGGDRENYLELFRDYCDKHRVRVLAYCLMTNHVHLVLIPYEESSLANAVGLTHQLYTTYYNDRYEKSGHLWQSRFFSCPMDEDHTLNAIAYTELNPVRARMVREAPDYRWSSARAHLGIEGNPLLNLERWFTRFGPADWKQTLEDFPGNAHMAETIRSHTRRGTPLGRNKQFLDRVRAFQSRD